MAALSEAVNRDTDPSQKGERELDARSNRGLASRPPYADAQWYDEDGGVGLRDLFGTLRARIWWIVGSVLLVSAAFAAVAFLMTPVYRATTVLVPAAADRGGDVVGFGGGQLGSLASVAGISLGPRDAETEEALAVLRSRQLTEDFINSKNLIPELFARDWDSARGAWKVDADHQPTPGKAYKYFDEKIRSVVQDKKTGLITIQIDWTDRNESAVWANDLVHQLNDEMRARAIAKADASMRFLEKELQSTATVEARDAIGRLMEAQVKQRMLANVTQDYSFRVVDKATASDRDDPIRPRKKVLIIVGIVLGFAVGVVLALFLGPVSTPQR
jgi:uncharacterized protein involved in exopolysaccharide biosynthesis